MINRLRTRQSWKKYGPYGQGDDMRSWGSWVLLGIIFQGPLRERLLWSKE